MPTIHSWMLNQASINLHQFEMGWVVGRDSHSGHSRHQSLTKKHVKSIHSFTTIYIQNAMASMCDTEQTERIEPYVFVCS